MNNVAPSPQISDHDRLGLTLFLAVMLHGIIILGISFNLFTKDEQNSAPTLDIILVQSQNQTENDEADYFAQVSQQGGGESKESTRPSDLFTAPSMSENPGTAIQESIQQKVSTVAIEELSLITQSESDFSIETDVNQQAENEIALDNEYSSHQNQNIARLAKELDKKIEHQSSASKVKYLNSSTKEFIPAQYMHSWIKKVERIGNLNYPDQARRQKLNGTLILDVVINSEGQLISTDLRRSSGHQILDDAAVRIVQLAAPYSPFPKKLKEIADTIHITRSWEFFDNKNIRSK